MRGKTRWGWPYRDRPKYGNEVVATIWLAETWSYGHDIAVENYQRSYAAFTVASSSCARDGLRPCAAIIVAASPCETASVRVLPSLAFKLPFMIPVLSFALDWCSYIYPLCSITTNTAWKSVVEHTKRRITFFKLCNFQLYLVLMIFRADLYVYILVRMIFKCFLYPQVL